MAAGKNGDLHLVMFPFLAFGHINPFIQLSNKLSSYPGVKISFLTATPNVRRVKSILNPTIEIVSFTLPPVAGLPPGIGSTNDTSPATFELLKVALSLMQPQMKTLLKDLKPHFVFFDFAQPWVPSMASDLNIKTIFFSSVLTIASAYAAAYISVQTIDLTVEEIKIPPPGFPTTIDLKTFEALDFQYVFKSFHGTPSLFNCLMKCFNECDVVLVKSCREMEGPYIDYLSKQLGKQIHLIGPVVPEPNSGELEQKWANWLSQFPPKSVIYCCCGSEAYLTDDQIKELALGLELTGFPFLLALNFPANVDGSEELKRTLPEGFTERIKERGVIHSGWVQQRHILAHISVGCFLTHVGFGSLVEGLVNDCLLVMLPLKADQFMNTKLLAFDLKVGVEVNRRDEDGYFTKEDINEVVRRVMMTDVEDEDGKSIRENHKKWKEFLQNNEIQKGYVKDFGGEHEGSFPWINKYLVYYHDDEIYIHIYI